MSKPTESYLTSQNPVPYLRLESARQRLALPYATLLGIELATDDNSLKLDFASHQVTVHGKRLYEIYCSVSAGTCAALFGRSELHELQTGPGTDKPVIQELHIRLSKAQTEPLE
jgi:hypothetical protein